MSTIITIQLFSGEVLSYIANVDVTAKSIVSAGRYHLHTSHKRRIQRLVLDHLGLEEETHFTKLLYDSESEDKNRLHAFVQSWEEHDQACRDTCRELLERASDRMDCYYLTRVVENGIACATNSEEKGEFLEDAERFIQSYSNKLR